MKAIFSGAQLGHAPTRFLSKGHVVSYPDSPDRARALLEGAREASAQICAARRFDPEEFASVHARPYLAFLQDGFAMWQQLDGAGAEMIPSLRPTVAPAIAHSSHVMAAAGRFMMDFSCALTARSWPSISASAMTALTAAELCAKGETVCYALCRPSGHHAYADRAGGFCYLNNSALAAQHLLSKHERIAILDVDVHHGNGTQSIFYQRSDVLTVSIHGDPLEFYPYYWGAAGETGEGPGTGFNLNLPIPVGSGDDVWLGEIDNALRTISSFGPGALVLALGLDAHEADPLKGGTVTQGGFAKIAEKIASLNLPTVIVQEGGYLTEHLSDNLAMFLSAYEGALEVSVQTAAE